MIYYINCHIPLETNNAINDNIIIYGLSDDILYPFISLMRKQNRYQIHHPYSGPERFY